MALVRSLRARVVLWVSVALVVLFVATGFVLDLAFRNNTDEARRELLEVQVLGLIALAETKLVDDFATKYKKTVVKSDRAAFQKVFVPFHTGPDATWDKALYDKVQAIK